MVVPRHSTTKDGTLARRTHGTRWCYIDTRCRCDLCRIATNAYERLVRIRRNHPNFYQGGVTSTEAAFFRNIAPRGDCWEWQRSLNSQGYARLSISGSRIYAHRWIYEFMRAPIPDGLQIDHLCRNRWCVNPWHLEPVTQRENLLRGVGVSSRIARGVAA